jgi:VanZ family protein
MKTTKIFTYWAPVIFWMACIYWISSDTFSSQHTSRIIEPVLRYLAPSISAREIYAIQGGIRKLAHVAVYFIFGILLFRAFRGGEEERSNWRYVFSSLLVIVLYAASDEFHQSFFSTRTASLLDIVIDTFGGFLAQCVSVLLHSRRQK